MSVALAGYDLRTARKRYGVGINQLARLLGRDPGHLSRVERGERPVTPALIMQYERVLNTTIRPTGEWVDPGAAMATVEEREDTVRRRRFVQTLTGMAVAASPSLIALEALRRSIDHAVGGDVDQWNALAAGYGLAYYSTPPDVLRDRLAVDLAVLGRLMADHPDDPDLERASAGLSMVLAIALTSIGEAWTARRWWETARRAADKSTDRGMRVMTRSWSAVKGLYDGRPLPEVLSLADETVALAGQRVCPGTAGVLAGRAQALAISGRHAEAAAAVRDVERITERMPAAVLNDESMFGWPEHRLRHTESFVLTEIGDTGRALAAQDRALELLPRAHAGNRAMVQMHRASCLIQEGHVADGLRYAADGLDALPVERRHDRLVYEVACRALAAVPQSERRRPEAEDLRDRLTPRTGRPASP